MQFYSKKNYILMFISVCLNLNTAYSQFGNDTIPISSPDEKNGFDDREGTMFVNLKIKEIQYKATFRHYNYDIDNRFQYQGDIQGAIVHLLQNTWSYSTLHIRFLNQPSKNRYVYFHSQGHNMSSIKFKGDKENNMEAKIAKGFGLNKKEFYVEGREIIMEVLKRKFKFEVETLMDSLDVVSVIAVDKEKMSQFIIEWDKIGYECSWNKLPKPNFCVQSLMFGFANVLESQWNVYIEDKTNTYPLQYFFKFPSHLFESFQKFEALDTFVRANYGFALTKRKELRPVYCIKFL
jgi:hypothetical protein